MTTGREERHQRCKGEDTEMPSVGREWRRGQNPRRVRDLCPCELEECACKEERREVAGEKDAEACGYAFGMTAHGTGAAGEKRGPAQ